MGVKAKNKIVSGLEEAQRVAAGLEPAARMHIAGYTYVPESRLDEIVKALEPFATLVEAIECTSGYLYDDDDEWPVEIGKLRAARTLLDRFKSQC